MRHTRDHWTGRPIPYFALHRNGFTLPPSLPRGRWALTPPFHPYPTASSRAVSFLWHWPSGRLTPACPPFQEESCPMVSGLSSPARSKGEYPLPGKYRGRPRYGTGKDPSISNQENNRIPAPAHFKNQQSLTCNRYSRPSKLPPTRLQDAYPRYKIRPHWSQWLIPASFPKFPATSLETRKWQPLQFPPCNATTHGPFLTWFFTWL